MKKFTFLVFLSLFLIYNLNAQNLNTGTKHNVLNSNANSIKIEYNFAGFNQSDVKINGKTYLNLTANDMTQLMEKGFPQLPTYVRSVIIPDQSAMNFRIIEQDYYETTTQPIMPSKGHMTRNIDPEKIPFTFNQVYNMDTWYPVNNVVLDDPYIVRDLRGMTVHFNPVQYNAKKGMLRIYRRLVIEVFPDYGKMAVNPFYRLNPLRAVNGEFSDVYRGLFMNYQTDQTMYDSIPEPGKMLIICPTNYMSTMTPFVQWKQARGLNVTVAEYPTVTGTGNAAIKTYIQNMYNSPGSVTYIILVGDVADIPTNSGLYEAAPSDPCYVKLAGSDAYPDAFISRISVQTVASLNYVLKKLVRYERDPDLGSAGAWYHKGCNVASNSSGGTPPYYDWERANWLRDTMLNHGFTSVDQVYDPGATVQMVLNAVNPGRSLINYIGHGSGTSWSTTGFSCTNVYQLTNGYMNPFLIDVACLNGNLTLSECFEESWLRAGDTNNVKGAVGAFGSSTNASWVPPCDMQTHSVYLLVHGYRKSAGAICFFGVMKAMDLWGGSSGEGLKLMEQYNIFGDCSTMITFGVPFGPAITHTPLPNTENLTGPYAVNCVIAPMNAPLVSGQTKMFWTRGTSFTDSVVMTNTSGNNWTANIPGNGSNATYRYYIKTKDTMNRVATAPGGAPANYYSFVASSDNQNPVITTSAIPNTPKTQWPATVNATVTDNIGVDSVWVKWYKNNPSTGIKRFNLNISAGNNYVGAFNSTQAEVNYNDSIFYRVFARDISTSHNTDSTALFNFKIIAQTNVIVGTGTVSSNYPYTTYWMDGRTDMLYTAAEIIAGGGGAGIISRIGFNVISADLAPMNGFNVKIQNTSSTSLTGFVSSGWTVCYNGVYTLPGSGWQYINLTNPFVWNGTSNLLVEVCYNNSSYTQYSPVNATSISSMACGYYTDLSTGDGCTASWTATVLTARPNITFTINLTTGVNGEYTGIPKTYSLSQNYPNPFNPVTKINFEIPKQGFVNLQVYDILGREVKTLINEIKTAGRYSVDFNASEFASGVYFYKLVSNDFTDIKRMMLIK